MNKREMIVIGGGPAGLSAAIEAARRDVDVLLIDESIKPGGQLFKQIHKFFGSSAHRSGTRGIDIGKELVAEAYDLGVEIWLNSVVTGLFKEKKVAVEKQLKDGSKKMQIVEAEKVVIATGASENAINFEGWTLPGVMGAGAAQTMINVHRVLPGDKVLMIGSGNVGLIVSYQLLQAGAEVVGLVEAAPSIGGYGVHAAKIERAGVPIFTRHTILEAKGNEEKGVTSAVISQVDENWQPVSGAEKELDVDVITIAAGLKPLGELANMHGCQKTYVSALGGWVPIHNENMESTCAGIYVVGDVTGVEEANTALEEGRLAGIDAALQLGYIDQSEGKNLKQEIRDRVKGLRLGPFGEKRLEAKEKLVEEYNNLDSVVK